MPVYVPGTLEPGGPGIKVVREQDVQDGIPTPAAADDGKALVATGAGDGSTAWEQVDTEGIANDAVGVDQLDTASTGTTGQVLTRTDSGADWEDATGGGGSGATNLGVTRTGTAVTVTSSSGTNAEIARADTSDAGVMAAADKESLNYLASGVQHWESSDFTIDETWGLGHTVVVHGSSAVTATFSNISIDEPWVLHIVNIGTGLLTVQANAADFETEDGSDTGTYRQWEGITVSGRTNSQTNQSQFHVVGKMLDGRSAARLIEGIGTTANQFDLAQGAVIERAASGAGSEITSLGAGHSIVTNNVGGTVGNRGHFRFVGQSALAARLRTFGARALNVTSTTYPSSPHVGELVYDTDDDQFLVRSDSSSWELVHGRAFVGATAPSSPAAGWLFFDTDDNSLQVYDGSAWQTISGGSSGTDLSIANRGPETLDIASSTGDNATVPAASNTQTGLMTATLREKLWNLRRPSASELADQTDTDPRTPSVSDMYHIAESVAPSAGAGSGASGTCGDLPNKVPEGSREPGKDWNFKAEITPDAYGAGGHATGAAQIASAVYIADNSSGTVRGWSKTTRQYDSDLDFDLSFGSSGDAGQSGEMYAMCDANGGWLTLVEGTGQSRIGYVAEVNRDGSTKSRHHTLRAEMEGVPSPRGLTYTGGANGWMYVMGGDRKVWRKKITDNPDTASAWNNVHTLAIRGDMNNPRGIDFVSTPLGNEFLVLDGPDSDGKSWVHRFDEDWAFVRTIELPSQIGAPRGITCDGATAWITDTTDSRVYAVSIYERHDLVNDPSEWVEREFLDDFFINGSVPTTKRVWWTSGTDHSAGGYFKSEHNANGTAAAVTLELRGLFESAPAAIIFEGKAGLTGQSGDVPFRIFGPIIGGSYHIQRRLQVYGGNTRTATDFRIFSGWPQLADEQSDSLHIWTDSASHVSLTFTSIRALYRRQPPEVMPAVNTEHLRYIGSLNNDPVDRCTLDLAQQVTETIERNSAEIDRVEEVFSPEYSTSNSADAQWIADPASPGAAHFEGVGFVVTSDVDFFQALVGTASATGDLGPINATADRLTAVDSDGTSVPLAIAAYKYIEDYQGVDSGVIEFNLIWHGDQDLVRRADSYTLHAGSQSVTLVVDSIDYPPTFSTVGTSGASEESNVAITRFYPPGVGYLHADDVYMAMKAEAKVLLTDEHLDGISITSGVATFDGFKANAGELDLTALADSAFPAGIREIDHDGTISGTGTTASPLSARVDRHSPLDVASDRTVLADDDGKLLILSGASGTLTLPNATVMATIRDGWRIYYEAGGGDWTVSADSTETINGVASGTFLVPENSTGHVVKTGDTAWRAYVDHLPKADTAAAEAGTDDFRYMTPLKTKAAIDEFAPGGGGGGGGGGTPVPTVAEVRGNQYRISRGRKSIWDTNVDTAEGVISWRATIPGGTSTGPSGTGRVTIQIPSGQQAVAGRTQNITSVTLPGPDSTSQTTTVSASGDMGATVETGMTLLVEQNGWRSWQLIGDSTGGSYSQPTTLSAITDPTNMSQVVGELDWSQPIRLAVVDYADDSLNMSDFTITDEATDQGIPLDDPQMRDIYWIQRAQANSPYDTGLSEVTLGTGDDAHTLTFADAGQYHIHIEVDADCVGVSNSTAVRHAFDLEISSSNQGLLWNIPSSYARSPLGQTDPPGTTTTAQGEGSNRTHVLEELDIQVAAGETLRFKIGKDRGSSQHQNARMVFHGDLSITQIWSRPSVANAVSTVGAKLATFSGFPTHGNVIDAGSAVTPSSVTLETALPGYSDATGANGIIAWSSLPIPPDNVDGIWVKSYVDGTEIWRSKLPWIGGLENNASPFQTIGIIALSSNQKLVLVWQAFPNLTTPCNIHILGAQTSIPTSGVTVELFEAGVFLS